MYMYYIALQSGNFLFVVPWMIHFSPIFVSLEIYQERLQELYMLDI